MTAASFQTTVNQFMGFGVPGEVFDAGPFRAMPYMIDSLLPGPIDNSANNIFGRAFSLYLPGGDGVAQVGNTSDDYPFAGILVGPKNYALYGDGVSALNPSLTLPNGAIGQFATMGQVVVTLSTTATPGDLIVFSNTTGALYAIGAADPLPVDKSPAYAKVVRFTFGSPTNIGVIELDPTIVYQPRA